MHRALRHVRTFVALAVVAFVFAGCSDSSGNDPTRLVVRNTSSEAVSDLYFSKCNDIDWGSDRLGNDVISTGASRTWTLDPGCWDMLAGMVSGVEVERLDEQIDKGETFTWTITD